MQQTDKKAVNSEKENPSPDGTSSSSNSSPTKSRVLVPDSSSLPLARLKTELVEKTKLMEGVLELFAKEWERLEACRANVERERNDFESMKAKIAQVHFPQQIKLSIGGTIFETSLQNIRRDPDSMLGAMFSGKGFLVEPNKDGAYFIDRDGTHFHFIMTYLRAGRIVLPEDEGSLEMLLEEAEFYQLRDIIAAIKDGLFAKESKIVTKVEWRRTLEQWVSGNKKKKWSLMYCGSRDGFRAADFHRMMDGKGENFVIVQTDAGCIFGGYTAVGWRGQHSTPYVVDPQMFIFTLLNTSNVPPTTFRPVPNQGYIYDNPSLLAAFGQGPSLTVVDNCNLGPHSSCNFPNNFCDTTKVGRNLFTPLSSSFKVVEIEAWIPDNS